MTPRAPLTFAALALGPGSAMKPRWQRPPARAWSSGVDVAGREALLALDLCLQPTGRELGHDLRRAPDLHASKQPAREDRARALAGGVTPGDPPGFPVIINRPGSYGLAGLRRQHPVRSTDASRMASTARALSQRARAQPLFPARYRSTNPRTCPGTIARIRRGAAR